jgi:hypothetical protein
VSVPVSLFVCVCCCVWVGQVRARILYVDAASKMVALTLRPPLVQLSSALFSSSVRQNAHMYIYTHAQTHTHTHVRMRTHAVFPKRAPAQTPTCSCVCFCLSVILCVSMGLSLSLSLCACGVALAQASVAYGAIVETVTVRAVDGAHGLLVELPEGEAGYVNVRTRRL